MIDVIAYPSVFFSFYTVSISASICRSPIGSASLENSGSFTVLVFSSIAEVKHWPKANWVKRFYLLYAFMSQSSQGMNSSRSHGRNHGRKPFTLSLSMAWSPCLLMQPRTPWSRVLPSTWSEPSLINHKNASQTWLQGNPTSLFLGKSSLCQVDKD